MLDPEPDNPKPSPCRLNGRLFEPTPAGLLVPEGAVNPPGPAVRAGLRAAFERCAVIAGRFNAIVTAAQHVFTAAQHVIAWLRQ